MKKTWVNTKIFGKDFWFMTHQLSMCTTWLLTLAGFVIILVDSNRWTTNPHSVLGTITFCLCFVQPIGAVFRPGPKDMTRPVFNFLHLSAGNFAHLLAVFTMFYSVNLVRSELPASFTFTLIAFVVLYVTFYITMTVSLRLWLLNPLDTIIDKKENFEISQFDYLIRLPIAKSYFKSVFNCSIFIFLHTLDHGFFQYAKKV